ncbi:PP2C family serine/threonine-protein phosphatase [Candidatus Thiodictyon syntrophicum]|jgi:hypothetical protein|nr:PP2C family serine/threonine-protein phosphatase [Candidatus Thiodictyon syntrophicum]
MTWRAYGASVCGSSHRRTALPCQDAHGWRSLPGDAGILCAVADGLGSAARAETGARCAVDAALDALKWALAADPPPTGETAVAETVRAAFAAARVALEAAAGDAPLRDLATTLILAAAAPGWTAVGQIGDGAAVGSWPDGRLETLSLPQRCEYANETVPLTAADALDRVQIRVWPAPVQSLVLFSDGLQSLALNLASGSPFAPFFAPFLQALADPFDSDATSARLAAFLDSERVCARTGDDKTLLAAGLAERA